jgi:hypothetical protein
MVWGDRRTCVSWESWRWALAELGYSQIRNRPLPGNLRYYGANAYGDLNELSYLRKTR